MLVSSHRRARTLLAAIGLALPLLGVSTAAYADPADKPAPQTVPGMRQLTPEEVEKLRQRKKDGLSKEDMEKAAAAQAEKKAAGAVELPKAIELSESSFDWGNISDTDPVSHTFKVKNITDKTIKIAVAASCGCTVGKLEKDVLEPNEQVDVTASFNPQGRNGPQTKTLTITVVEPQGVYAQQTNTLTSNVKAMVTLEPQKVFLNEVDHREGQQSKLTVVARKPGFQVTGVETGSEFIKAKVGEVQEVEENGEKLTKVTIDLDVGKGAPIGSMNGQLTIKTNDEKGKPINAFVGADVIGDIRATPPSTMMRASAPGAVISAQIKLDTRSSKPFRIASIDIEGRSDLKLVTDFSSGENNQGYTITLSGVAPDQPGLVQGAVVIATDSQGGESIKVPWTLTVPRAAQPKPANAPAAPTAAAPAAPGAAPVAPAKVPAAPAAPAKPSPADAPISPTKPK